MKIKYTIELEIPDMEIDPDFKKAWDEGHTGKTCEMGLVEDAVFTGFTHFALCQHLITAMEWMIKENASTCIRSKETSKHIVANHKLWADILKKAERTVKIEEIKS